MRQGHRGFRAVRFCRADEEDCRRDLAVLEVVPGGRGPAELGGLRLADRLAEFAVGIALVLGLFTRAAAAGGALLMVLILLGTGRGEPGASLGDWITAGMTA
jgi:hypothetical protein